MTTYNDLIDECRMRAKTNDQLMDEFGDSEDKGYWRGRRDAFNLAAERLTELAKAVMPLPLPDEEEGEEEEEGEDFTVSDEEATYAYFQLITRYPFEQVCQFGTADVPYPKWLRKEILAIRRVRDEIKEKYLRRSD